MRHRIALVVVLVALGAVGCSQESGRAVPPPPPEPRPFAGITYPTADERQLMHRATEVVVADCMRAKHQPYQLTAPADPTRLAAASPYGLLDPRRAEVDGYGIVGEAADAASNAPVDVNKGAVAAMSPAQRRHWTEALTGTAGHRRTIRLPDRTTTSFATDGCVSTGRRELYGPDWERLVALAQSRSNLVIDRVVSAPAVVRAVTVWSACMARQHWAFDRLAGPRDDISARWAAARTDVDRAQVGRRELSMARADSRCQLETRLATTVDAAQREVERELTTPAVAADLAAMRAAWSAAKARAAKLLAASPG